MVLKRVTVATVVSSSSWWWYGFFLSKYREISSRRPSTRLYVRYEIRFAFGVFCAVYLSYLLWLLGCHGALLFFQKVSSVGCVTTMGTTQKVIVGLISLNPGVQKAKGPYWKEKSCCRGWTTRDVVCKSALRVRELRRFASSIACFAYSMMHRLLQ